MKKNSIPVHEKYVLTIREAAEYFNIGLKRMRQLAEENTDSFGLWSGNRFLIIRKKKICSIRRRRLSSMA